MEGSIDSPEEMRRAATKRRPEEVTVNQIGQGNNSKTVKTRNASRKDNSLAFWTRSHDVDAAGRGRVVGKAGVLRDADDYVSQYVGTS